MSDDILIDDEMNRDWLRGMRWPDHMPSNLASLREWLAARQMTVTRFKQMPMYKYAIRRGDPAWLKDL